MQRVLAAGAICVCVLVRSSSGSRLRRNISPVGDRTNVAPSTGIVCRELAGETGEQDADVVLREGNQRDLVFSREVVVNGEQLGREVSGEQTTIRCRGAAPAACVASSVLPPPCSRAVAAACPCEVEAAEIPELPYQRLMLQEVVPACLHAENLTFRVLMVGLGGGAMPMYLRRHCSAAQIESVEPDGRVVKIAQRLLGFERDTKNQIDESDGLAALERHATVQQAGYDFVLVDCFSGGHVPEPCRSPAFVAAAGKVLRKHGGRLLQNTVMPEAENLSKTYTSVFGVRTNSTEVQKGQRIIMAWA